MKATGRLINRSVLIPSAGLEGDLVLPEKTRAVIAFAHGSGSSRHSPRNQYVARVLQQGGLATLLFDLVRPRYSCGTAVVFEQPAQAFSAED